MKSVLLVTLFLVQTTALAGVEFFGPELGQKVSNFKSCGEYGTPQSLRPKSECLVHPFRKNGGFIDYELSSKYPTSSLFDRELKIASDDNGTIVYIQYFSKSKYHNQLLSLLTAEFGKPNESKDKIGSIFGKEFDETGTAVSMKYHWIKAEKNIVYFPYSSSRSSSAVVKIFTKKSGPFLSKLDSQLLTQPEEPVKKISEIKPCFEDVCVGQEVSSLSQSIKWITPTGNDVRNLFARLAEEKKDGNSIIIKNTESDIKDNEKELALVYRGDAKSIKNLAKYNNTLGSGTNLGKRWVGPEIFNELSKITSACKPLGWILKFKSKSGYMTNVWIAISPKDQTGAHQSLIVQKIEREYSDLKTDEELFALKKKLEAATGLKEGQYLNGTQLPVLYIFSETVTISSPLTLEHDSNVAILQKHKSCQKNISID